MKCVIPGINVKIFGRTVHSLSKIGDELYFEPLQQGLAIRTVNSTRSAYAYVLFAPSFFSHYDDGSSLIQTNTAGDDDDTLRCKVNMKSILTVFKSLSSIEKSVERCKISLNNQDSRLVFQLYCKHGIVKTHNLAFIECETLQAVFSKDLTPNKLTAHPKVLCDAVMNFQNNQEEVTLIAKPDKISLKNYVDDEPDPKKVVLTEMHLNPKEFDNCQLGLDAEITFCLKELRAILGLADVISLPLNIHFERAGRPVVISIDSDVTFEANFVLATLADVEGSSNSQPQSVSQSTSKKKSKSKSDHKRSQDLSHTNHEEEYEDDFEEMICNDPTVEQMTSMVTENSSRRDSRSNISSHNRSVRKESKTNGTMKPGHSVKHAAKSSSSSSSISNDMNQNPSLSSLSTTSNSSERLSTEFAPRLERDSSSQPAEEQSGSPVIPFQSEPFKPHLSALRLDESEVQDVNEDDNDDDDIIPGTPPSKKFKSMIFGFSQNSTQSEPTQQPGTVLAEDTDEDD